MFKKLYDGLIRLFTVESERGIVKAPHDILILDVLIWLVLLKKSRKARKVCTLFLISQVLSVAMLIYASVANSSYLSIHKGDCCIPRGCKEYQDGSVNCPAVCSTCPNPKDQQLVLVNPALFVGKVVLLVAGTVVTVKLNQRH